MCFRKKGYLEREGVPTLEESMRAIKKHSDNLKFASEMLPVLYHKRNN